MEKFRLLRSEEFEIGTSEHVKTRAKRVNVMTCLLKVYISML